MSKRVKVTLSTDHYEVVNVADDYKVEPPLNNDEWLEVHAEDGGVWYFPAHLVVGVVMEGPPKRKK